MKHFILILATGFGVGYSPVAPGTVGTLVAIPVYYFLSNISSPIYEITLIGFFFLSVWISENAEIFFGKKDDRRIVIDEIMGFLITMLWVPKTIRFIIIAFFLLKYLRLSFLLSWPNPSSSPPSPCPSPSRREDEVRNDLKNNIRIDSGHHII